LAVRTAEAREKELKRKLARVMRILEERYGPHIYPEERSSLLEQLLFELLASANPVTNARKCLRDFREAYVDWNEVRVSSVREIQETLDRARIEASGETAALVKSVLDRTFNELCRVDLDHLRSEGAEKARKFAARLDMLKPHEREYFLVAAGFETAPPLDPATERACERLGLFRPEDPPAKRRRALESAVESGAEALRLHHLLVEHGKKLCTATDPKCAKCLLQTDCDFFRTAGEERKKAAKRGATAGRGKKAPAGAPPAGKKGARAPARSRRDASEDE
jgi:endonuclease-3